MLWHLIEQKIVHKERFFFKNLKGRFAVIFILTSSFVVSTQLQNIIKRHNMHSKTEGIKIQKNQKFCQGSTELQVFKDRRVKQQPSKF